jgi:hypothetical protein
MAYKLLNQNGELVFMLPPEEKAIVDYLKAWPVTYVSGREIARRVGGRQRYEEDRSWAIPFLMELITKGLVETDGLGSYKLVKHEDRKKNFSRPISPQILRILRASGKTFAGTVINLDEDAEDDKDEDQETDATK